MNFNESSPSQNVPTRRAYKILGIAGSLRRESFSAAILRALIRAFEADTDFDFAGIGTLPHFNQDLYRDPLPDPVARFRQQIAAADGLLISSPEYNHGIPGVLKNAIDWASRPHNSSPLRGKPVLIVTSSPAFTGGVRAQYQIREALVSALACPVSTPELVVGSVASKMEANIFSDEPTIEFARSAFQTMFAQIARAA